MDYREQANAVLRKIEAYKSDDEGWKVVKKTKDAIIWSKPSSEWNGSIYRGEATIEASPEIVFAYVDPNPEGPRCSWDKAIKQLAVVEKLAEDLSVMRTVTHSGFGGLISSRDFIDIVLSITTESYLSTNAAATQHPDAPPTSEEVRGTNYPCSIICNRVPGEATQTRVVTYIQTDLGGMLPQTLVDNALPSNIIDFFTTLKEKLQDDNKWNGVNGE